MLQSFLCRSRTVPPKARPPKALLIMFSCKHKKLRILASLAMVFSLVSATSCTGFFQNPVLSTVTVGPTSLNLNQGATQQMTATGTYNDGSTKNLTTGVVWSSSDTS